MTVLDLSRVHAEPAAERLAVAIDEIARYDAARIAVVADAGGPDRRAVRYADLAASAAALESTLHATNPPGVVVRARRLESLVAAAAACGRQGVAVALVPDDARDLHAAGYHAVLVGESLVSSADPRGAVRALREA